MKIKIHGTGNAWPVMLGEEHPFYDRKSPAELANAAFSLYLQDDRKKGMEREILVDAGHGTIQSLLSGENRIPEAICLTHGHMDHTLSLDWVAQSFYKKHNKERKYPVYATLPVYESLLRSYPQLEKMTALNELLPGVPMTIREAPGITLTAYPVFHGESAVGACMLLFESVRERVLFTGDVFTPLLRPVDYGAISHPDLLVVDANNRFPWPRTNHWSIAGSPGQPLERSEKLADFCQFGCLSYLIAPHIRLHKNDVVHQYLDQFLKGYKKDQPFTVLEFLKRIRPKKAILVHYSGTEDQKYYGQPILDREALKKWTMNVAADAGIDTEIVLPLAGEIYDIHG